MRCIGDRGSWDGDILLERISIVNAYKELIKIDPLFRRNPPEIEEINYPFADHLASRIEGMRITDRRDQIFNEYLPRLRTAIKNMLAKKYPR
jgi:hypothetical protein